MTEREILVGGGEGPYRGEGWERGHVVVEGGVQKGGDERGVKLRHACLGVGRLGISEGKAGRPIIEEE